jgi:hypothetical protein
MMAVKTDFENCLADLINVKANLRRREEEVDSLGQASYSEHRNIPIACFMKKISDKQRMLLPAGTAFEGRMMGYFKASYSWMGTTYYVTEGDEVEFKDIIWRVEKILKKPEVDDTVIYIKALMHRMT